MEDFTISNHPVLLDITRTVQLTKMSLDMFEKELTLYLKIKHYLSDIYIPEMDKNIMSIACNDTQYPTGQPAPDPYYVDILDEFGQQILDENNNPLQELITPEAPTIGEFDYWNYLYSLGTPLSQMLQDGITNMDLRNTINNKCNYLS